jgi:hypothetical protein
MQPDHAALVLELGTSISGDCNLANRFGFAYPSPFSDWDR